MVNNEEGRVCPRCKQKRPIASFKKAKICEPCRQKQASILLQCQLCHKPRPRVYSRRGKCNYCSRKKSKKEILEELEKKGIKDGGKALAAQDNKKHPDKCRKCGKDFLADDFIFDIQQQRFKPKCRKCGYRYQKLQNNDSSSDEATIRKPKGIKKQLDDNKDHECCDRVIAGKNKSLYWASAGTS